jgi:hypothetical protein
MIPFLVRLTDFCNLFIPQISFKDGAEFPHKITNGAHNFLHRKTFQKVDWKFVIFPTIGQNVKGETRQDDLTGVG